MKKTNPIPHFIVKDSFGGLSSFRILTLPIESKIFDNIRDHLGEGITIFELKDPLVKQFLYFKGKKPFKIRTEFKGHYSSFFKTKNGYCSLYYKYKNQELTQKKFDSSCQSHSLNGPYRKITKFKVKKETLFAIHGQRVSRLVFEKAKKKKEDKESLFSKI